MLKGREFVFAHGRQKQQDQVAERKKWIKMRVGLLTDDLVGFSTSYYKKVLKGRFFLLKIIVLEAMNL